MAAATATRPRARRPVPPPTRGTCALTLTLTVEGAETVYRLTRRPGDVWTMTKGDGTSYEVCAPYEGLPASCSCPDHQYRPNELGCKHIRALRAWGLL